jgi:hypothetical protein
MKRMRKTRINAAVTAALVGLAGTAGMAEAQTVERTGTGQVLIFPYYTVNDGWITTFNVMNTSTSTLAVKFRLRESKNSRDVLDFNVVFSPYDVWTAWVKQDPESGSAQIFTNDKSCTSPTVDKINGATANPIAYSGSQADGGGSGLGRLRDGYVEMLVMGESSAPIQPPGLGEVGTVPYWAEHVDGVPRDCVRVDRAFLAQTTWNQVDDLATVGTDPGTGDPTARADFAQPTSNPLKGNVSWLKISNGAGAGSTALAVSDWAEGNLVTAQEFPWFLEPTFVTNQTPWTLNVTALSNFESAIGVSTAFNEWADNPNSGAATDWVITFPTKAYHVDKFNRQIQAAVSGYRTGGVNPATGAATPVVNCTSDALADRGSCVDAGVVPLEPFTNLFGVEADGVEPLGDSKVLVTYTFFDREEAGIVTETGETEISPAPPPEIQVAALRYEANVIQFADQSILSATKAAVVDPTLRPDGAINGWGSLTFPTGGATGMPAVGFAVKARNQGEQSSNYGQAMDHGYACPNGQCTPAATGSGSITPTN